MLEAIDKLRDQAEREPLALAQILHSLADEIEAEIAEKYIELPTCKDGVIKIGCDIGNECCHIGKIDTMLFDAEGAWEVLSNGNGWAVTGDEYYYVKPRTLEDVLTEMLDRNSDGVGLREFNRDFDAFVAHYADEIRDLCCQNEDKKPLQGNSVSNGVYAVYDKQTR